MKTLYRVTNGQVREIQADPRKAIKLMAKGWTEIKPGEEKPKRGRKPKAESE